ncbi:MAG: TetR/AcrR family transcriptional regulator, partial [Pseudomonadota bacterium]
MAEGTDPNLPEAGRSSVAGCGVEEQILDAGLHVFLRQGYAATKDDDVALAAGLPVDQVRSHFATKEILFCMVLDRESERARRGYLGGIPNFDTALDAFRYGAEQYRRGVLDTELTALWRCANEEI